MVELKDLCKKASSNIAQKDLDGHTGEYPIYGASGLIGYVDFYKQEKPYIAVVKDGAGIGRVMSLPAKSSVIGTMQYILPNDDVDAQYLSFAMENMNLAKYFSGATIPHIYFKDYCTEKLPKHSEKEQKQISAVLSKVTELISLRKKQLAKLDELVKARFVEMFDGNGYSEMQLSQVCKKITDGTHKTPRYLDHGITFISAKNIIDGKLDFMDIKYISKGEYQEIQRRCQTEQGDVLLAKSGSLGMTAIVNTPQPLGLFESLAILKYDRTLLNNIFLCKQLQSESVQNQLMTNAKGVAVKHLHLNVISAIKIIVPPLELQNEFAAFVERVDQQKQTIQQSLEKLELMKKVLMQEYFGQHSPSRLRRQPPQGGSLNVAARQKPPSLREVDASEASRRKEFTCKMLPDFR